MNASSLFPGLVLLALTAVVAGLLTACGGSGAVTALSVRRNLLLAGSTRFVAAGVVDYVLPFYVDDAGRPDPDLRAYTDIDYRARTSIFRAMRADGVNLVRIPIALAGIEGDPYGLTEPAYIGRLVAVVHAAEAAGLRVIVCWWDAVNDGPALTTRYARLFPMMAAVHRAIGNDPSVVYEPDNEPHGVTWAQWVTVMAATVREWRRVIGYRGVLVLDTIGYSWSFSPDAARRVQALDRSLLGGPPQIVFANHRYPDGVGCFCGAALAAWERTVGRWVSTYPILGTEYGPYSAGYPPDVAWAVQLAGVLSRSAVPAGDNGMVSFVWSWIDPNSLTGADHLTLDAYGRLIRRTFWERE